MIGRTLNQRFTLDLELGRGGMGAVYRATDLVLERQVAIKVLRDLKGEEQTRQLRLEAQITARLHHEHIVRLYDFGVDGVMAYFVMEVVDGTSFQKRWRKLTLPERLQILIRATEALAYSHRQGVIHRDFKPGNILLTAADQPKLSDFGLSMLVDQAGEEVGTVRGTPHYMSPEQARGVRVDHRTDLYALGAVLYECGTGTPPFSGPVPAIIAQQVHQTPDPPRARNPELSPEFEGLILRMLAKDPEDRPCSAEAVADALKALPELRRATAETITVSGGLAVGVAGALNPDPGDGESGGNAAAMPTSTARATASRDRLRLARELLTAVEAEPVALTVIDRYLSGHYLAYLLGGSRRRGILLRRPLDPRNADRARLMLAMTYLMGTGPDDESLAQAAELLDARPDVRPRLSPILVIKYLASRDTPRKRKRFREVRQALAERSQHAQRAMLDERGLLNPGLMPQTLDDLWKLAPSRTEVDDQLVQRWNRVTEIWRNQPGFRDSVLRYATLRAASDPASLDLWPEVIYPLIERARWQRLRRSQAEAILDRIGAQLGLPDAGVRLDRSFRVAVPAQVAEKVESGLARFLDEPSLEEPLASDPDQQDARRLRSEDRGASFEDVRAESPPGETNLVRLSRPGLFRHTLGELRALWQEALAQQRAAGRGRPETAATRRGIPVGRYRIAAIPSLRSRAAGQIALQGMPNKQIELLVPSFTGGGSNSRPILAVWLYENQSLVITYIDHRSRQCYVLWDAATNRQCNFDSAEDLNHELFQLGIEVPDQLDRVLTKRFRPLEEGTGVPGPAST